MLPVDNRHGRLDETLRKHPTYTLKICGHSLGAGAAILLSYMLRRDHPTLRCFAYAPPGGFLTRRLATGCAEFVTSFVLNADLVPRLSVASMEKLRDDTLELLSRARVGKRRILTSLTVGGGDAHGDKYHATARALLYPQGCAPDTEFRRQLERFREVQARLAAERQAAVGDVALFPAGRIVHLVKTERPRATWWAGTCGGGTADTPYSPVWKGVDDFAEIVISPTLWLDHFPNRICLKMEEVARSFGIDVEL